MTKNLQTVYATLSLLVLIFCSRLGGIRLMKLTMKMTIVRPPSLKTCRTMS